MEKKKLSALKLVPSRGNGDPVTIPLPYEVEVYILDNEISSVAQLVVDLMNKVQVLENKIKDLNK